MALFSEPDRCVWYTADGFYYSAGEACLLSCHILSHISLMRGGLLERWPTVIIHMPPIAASCFVHLVLVAQPASLSPYGESCVGAFGLLKRRVDC